MQGSVVSGIRPRFRGLSQSQGQITHVLLTRSPLEYPRKGLSARLACVKHAASVRPEPGSNSPTKTCRKKCPGNKVAKGINPNSQSCTGAKKQKHLALAFLQHPVEFSKNKHTPYLTLTKRDSAPGR